MKRQCVFALYDCVCRMCVYISPVHETSSKCAPNTLKRESVCNRWRYLQPNQHALHSVFNAHNSLAIAMQMHQTLPLQRQARNGLCRWSIIVAILHCVQATRAPPSTNTSASMEYFAHSQGSTLLPIPPTTRSLRSVQKTRMCCVLYPPCVVSHIQSTPPSTGMFVPCSTNPNMRCCEPSQMHLTCTPPPWPIPGVGVGSQFGAFGQVCCCCSDMDARKGVGMARAGDVISVCVVRGSVARMYVCHTSYTHRNTTTTTHILLHVHQ